MSIFGNSVSNNFAKNEKRFDSISVSSNLRIPIISDISNPPSGFSFSQGGIYFDNTSEKLYVSNASSRLEEVSSAVPGGGGGTIEGAQNTAGGVGVFDTIVNGGITLQMRSIADTDTITAAVVGDNIVLNAISSPALRFGGVNYTIPAGPLNGQVLGWDSATSSLEWITSSGGGGIPFPHEENHFIDASGGVGNEKTLQFSLGSMDNGDNVRLSLPTSTSGNQVMVLRDEPQELTEKTLQSTTNVIAANKLYVDPTTPISMPTTGPTEGQVLTYTEDPSASLTWAPATPSYLYLLMEPEFVQGSGGTYIRNFPRIMNFGNTVKTTRGPVGNITISTNIILDDSRFTSFRNTSGSESVWNISVKTTFDSPNVGIVLESAELWINISTEAPADSSDEIAGNTLIPGGRYLSWIITNGAGSTSISKSQAALSTTIVVPDEHYVYIVAKPRYSNAGPADTWTMGGPSQRDRSSIAIVELP